MLSFVANGQNLVLNGDFEPVNCPATGSIDQIIPPWTDPWSSADHYGPCTFPGSTTTNNNMPPQSGDGNIGLYAYGQFPNSGLWNREYLIGRLSAPLVAGQQYRLSYWVYPVLAGLVEINVGIAGPGVFMSEEYPEIDLVSRITEDPRAIYPEQTITNRAAWNQVCLTYTARGGEQYITLGTFKPDNELNPQPLDPSFGSMFGYYLMDNIWLEEESAPVLSGSMGICPGETRTLGVPSGLSGEWDDGSTDTLRTISEPGDYTYTYLDGPCMRTDLVHVIGYNCEPCRVYIPNAFTPDGDGDNDSWKPVITCATEAYRLEIYNRWGDLLFRTADPEASWSPDMTTPNGTYLARLIMTYAYKDQLLPVERAVHITLLR